MIPAKPFVIPKRLVLEAYERVKANRVAAGVDGGSIEAFDRDWSRNLYRIWNRMSSGSYFPPAVKAVPIPKKTGGERILGVPTVSDRIAQTVVTLVLEPLLEPVFHDDSYGYRPGKSAHDALSVTRKRCWERDCVLEYDIRGLFDHIDHQLLLKALRHHCSERWVLLHVERWLTALMQGRDGKQTARTVGTPQGGPLSPVLANLFLHYALDHWLATHHPDIPFCRYADDGILHCRTEVEANHMRCPPWRAKRRRVVPGSREATRDTRRAEGAKGDPKGASERGVQSYGRPVCSRNELAMLWRNAG